LVIEVDELKIRDVYNDKKILFFLDILYYYVKVWIIIVNDSIILKYFKSFKKWEKKKECFCYMFWGSYSYDYNYLVS
jgi:hypothetical protein